MALIANAIRYAKDKPPHSVFLYGLAYLINYVYKRAGAAMLAAVQAAATVEELAVALEGLGLAPNDQRFADHLANYIRYAGNKQMLDAADVAAFATINTVAATTDLLYGLCTQHDARLTATWGEIDGQHFEPFLPATTRI